MRISYVLKGRSTLEKQRKVRGILIRKIIFFGVFRSELRCGVFFLLWHPLALWKGGVFRRFLVRPAFLRSIVNIWEHTLLFIDILLR